MNTLIGFLFIFLLAGCSSTKTTAHRETVGQAIANPKISALLQDSQATNASPAIIQLASVIARDTNNPDPLYSLGYLHAQNAQATKNNHEHDLAIAYFNEALALVPGNQSVLRALYNIYYDDTIHNTNAQAFTNAKTIFVQIPESLRAEMNPPSLAKYVFTAIQQEKKHESNRQDLREILLAARLEQPYNDNVYIQLAKIYGEDRYFSLALATLKYGAENIHDSVELYEAIASTYEQRSEANGCNYEHGGDIANAAKYHKLAIALKPDDQALHYNLSLTLFDQNLNQVALHENNILLDLNASSANLGTAAQNYSMLGYNQKANEYLQRAVQKGFSENNTTYHEIFMNQGDWQNAAKGFSTYIKTRENYSVYDLIKSDIISQQSKQQPWITGQKIALNSNWEENLFNYWNAKINADDLKKFALTRCEKTEYYFYTGYQDYQAGQIAQAKTKFAAALNQNTYRFIERPLARYFLQK